MIVIFTVAWLLGVEASRLPGRLPDAKRLRVRSPLTSLEAMETRVGNTSRKHEQVGTVSILLIVGNFILPITDQTVHPVGVPVGRYIPVGREE